MFDGNPSNDSVICAILLVVGVAGCYCTGEYATGEAFCGDRKRKAWLAASTVLWTAELVEMEYLIGLLIWRC